MMTLMGWRISGRCPEPLVSYVGTDSYVPTPEFEAYSDQADDLDEITARISRLTKALRAVAFTISR
jgi:hypothetical protein